VVRAGETALLQSEGGAIHLFDAEGGQTIG